MPVIEKSHTVWLIRESWTVQHSSIRGAHLSFISSDSLTRPLKISIQAATSSTLFSSNVLLIWICACRVVCGLCCRCERTVRSRVGLRLIGRRKNTSVAYCACLRFNLTYFLPVYLPSVWLPPAGATHPTLITNSRKHRLGGVQLLSSRLHCFLYLLAPVAKNKKKKTMTKTKQSGFIAVMTCQCIWSVMQVRLRGRRPWWKLSLPATTLRCGRQLNLRRGWWSGWGWSSPPSLDWWGTTFVYTVPINNGVTLTKQTWLIKTLQQR